MVSPPPASLRVVGILPTTAALRTRPKGRPRPYLAQSAFSSAATWANLIALLPLGTTPSGGGPIHEGATPCDIGRLRDTSGICALELFTVVATIYSPRYTPKKNNAAQAPLNNGVPPLLRRPIASPIMRCLASPFNLTMWFGRLSSASRSAAPLSWWVSPLFPTPPSFRFDLPSVKYCDDKISTYCETFGEVWNYIAPQAPGRRAIYKIGILTLFPDAPFITP